MNKERGFSLVELLVVVVVIGIIAAIAVPSLRRAKQSANSASAIQTLRMLTTAEHLYERKFKVYGTLAQLMPEATIDTTVISGTKSGYTFDLVVGPDGQSYSVTATPIEEPGILPHFYVDETTVIRFKDGAPADATSPPIPR